MALSRVVCPATVWGGCAGIDDKTMFKVLNLSIFRAPCRHCHTSVTLEPLFDVCVLLVPCVQATLVESALESVDDAAANGEAGGHAVDYETLPNAIVPVMSELFKAPLTPEEEYYALEVRRVFGVVSIVVLFRVVSFRLVSSAGVGHCRRD